MIDALLQGKLITKPIEKESQDGRHKPASANGSDNSIGLFQRKRYCSPLCGVLAQHGRAPGDFSKLERESRSLQSSWARAVKKRDGHCCQACSTAEKLQAHHIKEFKRYPRERWELDNGITLCVRCHWRVHNGLLKVSRKEGVNVVKQTGRLCSRR